MFSESELETLLRSWATILGDDPALGDEQPGRELWPVRAADGRRYFLKRLGPWRNLPVADQARIQAYLTAHGVGVAGFMITDAAQLVAGAVEDAFVLLPHVEHDALGHAEALPSEQRVGGCVADLHVALAAYPWSAHSYTEQIVGGLTGDLQLPPDVAELLGPHRDEIAGRLADLPVQLVHGDLNPDNVLVSRTPPAVAFIDFDHLPLAPRVWDVAKYLSRRLRQTSPADGLPHVTQMITGYQQVSPLSAPELDAVPAALLAANLLEADWIGRITAGLLPRRLLPGHEDEQRRTLGAIRWQLQNSAAVTGAVTAAVIGAVTGTVG